MKPWFRGLALAVLLVLLTGCVSVEMTVKAYPDGSADQETMVTLDRTMYGLIAGEGQDPLEDVRSTLEKQGFTVSQYEQDNQLGIRGQKHIGKLAYIAWDDSDLKGRLDVKQSLFWRDYSLNLDALFDGPEFKNPKAAAFLGQTDFRVTVELPTTVKHHNGQADGKGKVITWALVPGKKQHMTLTTRDYFWGRVGLAGCLAVLMTAMVVLYVIRSRRLSQHMARPR